MEDAGLMGFHGIYCGLLGSNGILWDLPLGKRLHNYGKSASSMEKTHYLDWAMFNSYVSLLEGILISH